MSVFVGVHPIFRKLFYTEYRRNTKKLEAYDDNDKATKLVRQISRTHQYTIENIMAYFDYLT